MTIMPGVPNAVIMLYSFTLGYVIESLIYALWLKYRESRSNRIVQRMIRGNLDRIKAIVEQSRQRESAKERARILIDNILKREE